MRSVVTVRRTVTFVLLSQLKLDVKFYLEANFQKLKRIATNPKSSLVSYYIGDKSTIIAYFRRSLCKHFHEKFGCRSTSKDH